MISVFLPLLIKCFLAWVGTGEYWQPHLNSSGSLLKWPKKVYLLEYKLFQHPACKTLKGKWWAGRRKLVNGKPQMRGRESPKWGEGKAQTGGREKSSCTAAPSGLMPGSSMKRSEFTCWRFQLCALFSTFNEHFCHNLSWKFNSLVIGTSFSQLTTQWVGEPD